MLIEKVLNNNVVITRDERNQEMIVMGKGLAFKKKVGDPIFDSCIDKKFQLTNDDFHNSSKNWHKRFLLST